MTNHLVTVTCPLSTLQAIADALHTAAHSAQFRAEMIKHVEALHIVNPDFPGGIRDTIDDVKYYEEDARTFQQAHDLAFNLYATSTDVTDPEAIAFYNRWHETDAEAPQTQAHALSEAVSF